MHSHPLTHCSDQAVDGSAHFLQPTAAATEEVALPICNGEAFPTVGAPCNAPTPAAGTNEALYAQLQPLITRLIRQFGTTHEMRQDLAGELYCRFCALQERFDPQRGVPMLPYLVRQLEMAAYSYARQQWRSERRWLPLETYMEATPPHTPEDPTSAWIHTLSEDPLLLGLPQALAGLPPRQRRVVTLRYYEDCSFEEIAEALAVKPATARSLLRHGLNKLRTILSPSSHNCF